MRLSTAFLILLAVSVVGFTGCKVRPASGLSSCRPSSKRLVRRVDRDRSAATIASSLAVRGTDQCDCYTCRTKRQDANYVIQPVGQPVSETVESQMSAPVLAPEVAPIVVPGASVEVEPGSVPSVVPDDIAEVETASPVEPQSQQSIPSEVVEDELPANELPPEASAPTPESTSTPEPTSTPAEEAASEPNLDAPSARLKRSNSAQRIEDPVVQYLPIRANLVPALRSAQRVEQRTLDNGFLLRPKTTRQPSAVIVAPIARRTDSIWFVPAASPESAETVHQATEHQATQHVATAPAITAPAVEVVTAKAQPNAVLHPVATENKPAKVKDVVAKQELQKLSPAGPIVLRARPVDRHLTYNGRPTQAPVREARLIQHSTYSRPHRRFVADQDYYQQLPPLSQRLESPAPAPAVASGSDVRPVGALPIGAASERSGFGNAATARTHQQHETTASPRARLVEPSTPLLKLNAVVGSQSPQVLPPIVTIQRQAETRSVHGTLQVPGTPAQDQSLQRQADGRHRLHTTPWQPMTVGNDGTRQVENSIRQLTIRPQRESAQVPGNTIDR